VASIDHTPAAAEGPRSISRADDGRLRGVEGVRAVVHRSTVEETRGSGVRVVALCPGATETRFFEATGKELMTHGRQTPEHVAALGLRAFDSGRRPSVVSGVANRMLASGYRIMPRAAMVRLARKRERMCAPRKDKSPVAEGLRSNLS
jgi:NAD(P)-dependent dehydrogenase (short-subunit alcohol dehydrogenase family)